MRQNLLNELDVALNHIETTYPELQSMVLTEVYQDESGYERVSYCEPVDYVLNGYENILKLIQEAVSQNRTYNVLTRNETRLGKEYHNEAISKLDYVSKRDDEKCIILELQWGY